MAHKRNYRIDIFINTLGLGGVEPYLTGYFNKAEAIVQYYLELNAARQSTKLDRLIINESDEVAIRRVLFKDIPVETDCLLMNEHGLPSHFIIRVTKE